MDAHAKLLRIYTDEAALFGDRRVFEIIAARGREARLAGLTVLQAIIGFGRSAHLHTRHILDDDQSVVIEIVEDEGPLRAFVRSLDDLSGIALITMESVEVVRAPQPPRQQGAA